MKNTTDIDHLAPEAQYLIRLAFGMGLVIGTVITSLAFIIF
jgi:hypothetical protein